MKNYFYNYVFKGLALTLFLTISSSLFAIDFDEQRKVIIPKFANAVYRDLTVLNEMTLNAEDSRVFLLELGKRPTYFWDKDHMFYTYLKSTLELENIEYSSSSDYKNIFTVKDMYINGPNGGAFYSEGMFLVPGANVKIANEDSNLFVKYNDDLNVNLHFENSVNYNVFSLLFGHKHIAGVERTTINEMYIRDLKLTSSDGNVVVNFPSTRAIVYQDNIQYKIKGSATAFELVSVNTAPKHYFGPWEIINGGKLSSGDPCGELPDNACKYTNSQGGGIKDSIFSIFGCDKVSGSLSGNNDPNTYFNPTDLCYDYQEVTLPNDEKFNNNKASYEFKVEEIYKINADSTAELISQTPKTRKLSNNDDPMAFMKRSGGQWALFTDHLQYQKIIINGKELPLGDNSNKNPQMIPAANTSSGENPCFYLCEGKLCDRNILYIRSDYVERTLKGGLNSNDLDNNWPLDDLKQDLHILTYTVGFCPQRIVNNNYAAFENNFDTVGDASKVIDGLLIKNGSNWVDSPKFCVSRRVKCDSLQGPSYGRHYKLLSTDY